MNITFEQSTNIVETYDFIEVRIHVENPSVANPFTEAEVFGQFGLDVEPFTFTHGLPDGELGTASIRPGLIPVDGFCDSDDGSLYRIRFMPSEAGAYSYEAVFTAGGQKYHTSGTFMAENRGRKGLLRVDPDFPFHFQWDNTKEHFFYHGMTAYHMPGIQDDAEIRRSIDRLHACKVNRIRIAVNSSRVRNGMAWFEPVYDSEDFTFLYGPWIAERPHDHTYPGWDVTRFDIAYWRKLERLLAYALSKDISVSLIMYLDAYRRGCDPFGPHHAGGLDEQRYYRYAAARLAAYSNITWDLTNEYRLIRPHAWVERMGYFLKSCDPYHHLMTCHGHETFDFRLSGWADFAVYQCWDEHGGYAYMLRNRETQLAMGRSIPQVNEEYGYEDHYPSAWGEGKKAPARSADRLRRIAWEIAMAGGYQTSGEYAGNGLGGWLNGRGDESMLLPKTLEPLVRFFEHLEWWKMNPGQVELIKGTGYCLAEQGRQYVIYAPEAGEIGIVLDRGSYEISWYNPREGTFYPGFRLDGSELVARCPDQEGDWVVRIQSAACRIPEKTTP
ncbi:hypothetical protein FHS19_000141 [Paenibacillus rhizosphaerae]|uniref:DUF5060 domain-containing protein n=1 Tax=Paenibacillus rhizosphaerae TaxID=297318 RepID=A0A839TKX9_9BACL|nr:DUF4038 domain-containing protein [Paenibacillus rhizosphaerae]MBB3125487.1 hypothetical protein [Paenibacillus rhizosphaerae]